LTLFRKSQAELPNSLHLQSSSALGTGKATSHQDHLDKREDIDVRRALDGQTGRRRRARDVYEIEEAEDDDLEDDQLSHVADNDAISNDVPSSAGPSAIVRPSTPAVGSALQRNADGSIVAPRIRPRKQKQVNIISPV
jgi:ATP-dependent RNA helicase DHX37/DHR1